MKLFFYSSFFVTSYAIVLGALPSGASSVADNSLQVIGYQDVFLQQSDSIDIPKASVPSSKAGASNSESLEVKAKGINDAILNNTEKLWSGSKMFHLSMDEDLKELIQNFCAIQDLEVIISQKVTGKVNKRFENITPLEFWNQIIRAYNLIYFSDGNILSIYKGEEIKAGIFTVPSAQMRAILDIISRLNFASSCFSLKVFESAGLIIANGPPRAIDILQELIEKVKLTIVESPEQQVAIRVFPLKYAWANDTTIAGTALPGVASILQQLLGLKKNQGSGGSIVNQVISAPSTVNKIKGNNASSPKQTSDSSNNKSDQKQAEDKDSFLPSEGGFITTDSRKNAIIVKDLKSKMSLYEELINKLDVPVDLIEISAAIINISTIASLDVGAKSVSWTKSGGHFDGAGFTNNANPTAKAASSPTWTGIANIKDIRGAGGILNGTSFLATIDALEKDNKAKTLHRPTVLTIDNLEATISSNDTQYISTAAQYQTDLFSVDASTTLKITPHVINEEKHKKIRLSVVIVDGKQKGKGSTDNVAATTNSTTITTQAVLLENQSLLVGGLYTQEVSKDRSGVPLLKDIPVLGLLFSSKSSSNDVKERLFLITPKIVDLEKTIDDQSPFASVFPKTVKEQGTAAPALLLDSDTSSKNTKKVVK